jgi:phosphate transport system substrate-binding protein
MMREKFKTFIVVILIFVIILFFVFSSSDRVKIKQKGSDTMLELAQLWSEEYVKINDNVTISVSGGGSGTGIAQLINNQIDIADASRIIKQSEIDNAKSKGVTPVEFKICIDGIAIITNKNLKIDEISIDGLRGIYNGSVKNWGKIGGPDSKITVYGRQSNSGTYAFFQEYVLKNDDYRVDMQPLNGNAQIVDVVIGDKEGIGYVGIAYAETRSDELNIIKIKISNNESGFLPTIENITSGDYPISRYLYIYTNGAPTGEIGDYVKWILNKEGGQRVAENLGFVPLPDSIKNEEMEKII